MPNVKNIRNMVGWFFTADPADPNHVYTNRGHAESVSLNLTSTREPVWVSGSGVRQKGDIIVTETGGTLTAVLRESTAHNLAVAYASGTDKVYEQTAQNAVIITGGAVKEGSAINLKHLKIRNLALASGSVDLVEGIDYELDAAAGVIEFKRAFSTFEGTYDADAILADARQLIISVLSREEGIPMDIMVVQKQRRGKSRQKIEGMRGIAFPEGDITLIKEDTGAVTITLNIELVANPNMPADEQYGRVIEIPN